MPDARTKASEDAVEKKEEAAHERFRRTVNAVCRTAFAALLAVEILGWAGVFVIEPAFTWFGMVLTLAVVWAAFEFLEIIRRRGKFIGFHWTTWPLAFLAVLVDAAGDVFQLYSIWWSYDRLAHFFGGAVAMITALNILHVVMQARRHHLPRWVVLPLAYGMTAVFSVLYEIEEFLEDRFTGSKRLGDGPDTVDDMMLNLLGAALVGVGYFIVRRMWKREPESR